MGKYRVKEPVAYIEGKKVVHHVRPADLVKIDDRTAAKLGDAVEARGVDPKPAESKPEPAKVAKADSSK